MVFPKRVKQFRKHFYSYNSFVMKDQHHEMVIRGDQAMEERRVNALASGADEGRDKLR